MNLRVLVDTSAAVDYLRPDRNAPPLDDNTTGLPLTVVGELFAGAFGSRDRDSNLQIIENLVKRWSIVIPVWETARIYGQLRANVPAEIGTSKRNDLWIAALCLQHNLPLLTNDGGFDHISGLTVIHW